MDGITGSNNARDCLTAAKGRYNTVPFGLFKKFMLQLISKYWTENVLHNSICCVPSTLT